MAEKQVKSLVGWFIGILNDHVIDNPNDQELAGCLGMHHGQGLRARSIPNYTILMG